MTIRRILGMRIETGHPWVKHEDDEKRLAQSIRSANRAIFKDGATTAKI
jgi:hypothetical protein